MQTKKKLLSFIGLLLMVTFLFSAAVFADEYDDLTVTVNGEELIMTSNYPSEMIPEGFTETRVYYEDDVFFGGLDDATESIQLFFLVSPTDETKSGFYQLQEDGSLVKYGETASEEGGEVAEPFIGETVDISGFSFTTEAIPESNPAPTGYSETSVVIENSSLTAYQKEGVTGDEVGIYLIYGSLDDNTGWYSYDQRENTIQRFYGSDNLQKLAEQEEQITTLQEQVKTINDKYNNNVGRANKLFVLMAVLALLFFFLMINAMVKRRHVKMDLEDRILDLKRHGGKETQNFSKRESRRLAKQDAKAEKRQVEDDVFDDDVMPMPVQEAPVERKTVSRETAYDDRPISDILAEEDDDLELFDLDDDNSGSTGKPSFDDDMDATAAALIQSADALASSELESSMQERAPKRPAKGMTEDMSAALAAVEEDDFDFDIIDLDDLD